MKTLRASSILVAALLLAVSGIDPRTTHAYSYLKECGSPVTWADKEVQFSAGVGSFPETHPRRQALLDAQKLLNDAPGRFLYSTPQWNDPKVGRHNGDEEIWFTDDHALLDFAPGRAFLWYACFMSEVDVVFYNKDSWSYSDIQNNKTTYGGSFRPWITGALHELGHATGLMHVNSEYNIMGADATHVSANDERVRYYAGEDAGDGQVRLYGATEAAVPNDVGVTHWKYGGLSNDPEYSAHALTVIDSDLLPSVPSDAFEGVRRYKVFENLPYQVEFTYENNGRDFQSGVDVGYYISTNRKVTTLDTLIATRTLNLARDDVSTVRHTVQLPELTMGQTYWLGAIVDRTKEIAEFNEINNATYIPIEVVCCD